VGVDQKVGEPIALIERKVLRTICDPKIENGVYMRRYSHEFNKDFNSPIALNVTKNAQRWLLGQKTRRLITKSSFQN
jgi:hypothetical protein